MSSTQITINGGNLANDPELRFTPNGVAVVNFTVMQTNSRFDRNENKWIDDEVANTWRCQAWKNVAENIAESLKKGDTVVVTGKQKSESYMDKEGVKRYSQVLEVIAIGPDLSRAQVQGISRVKRGNQGDGGNRGNGGNQGNGGGGNWGPPAQNNDPWGPPAQNNDPWGATPANNTPPF